MKTIEKSAYPSRFLARIRAFFRGEDGIVYIGHRETACAANLAVWESCCIADISCVAFVLHVSPILAVFPSAEAYFSMRRA